ncbi:MAG: hypothetical protein NTY80_02285 [candidate division SR1 bacterium]|nr:hypothetical protein [candidate division SR1 bacterium]
MKTLKLAWSTYKWRWALKLDADDIKIMDRFYLLFPLIYLFFGCSQFFVKFDIGPTFLTSVLILSWFVPTMLMVFASQRINEILRNQKKARDEKRILVDVEEAEDIMVEGLISLHRKCKIMSVFGVIICLLFILVSILRGFKLI